MGAATSDADFDDWGFTLAAGLTLAVVNGEVVLHLAHRTFGGAVSINAGARILDAFC